jgi:hypothetical protein
MSETPGFTIRELAPAEMPLILPLIEKHNAKVPPEELRRRLEEMIPKGYHCIAAFEDGAIVGIAGYWLITRFYSGGYMDVDNVVAAAKPSIYIQSIEQTQNRASTTSSGLPDI